MYQNCIRNISDNSFCCPLLLGWGVGPGSLESQQQQLACRCHRCKGRPHHSEGTYSGRHRFETLNTVNLNDLRWIYNIFMSVPAASQWRGLVSRRNRVSHSQPWWIHQVLADIHRRTTGQAQVKISFFECVLLFFSPHFLIHFFT